jgi:hypothetical protein
MSRLGLISLTMLGAAVIAVPLAVHAAGEKPAVARYDMRAGTVSGMSAMNGMGSALGMMFGGRGPSAQHELYLRLGSAQAPSGSLKADHFMPAAAQLGKSVALTVPPRSQPEKVPDVLPQMPKGRLLIFWGCGDHAPKGQPMVIDFAKLPGGQFAGGKMPPGITSSVMRDRGPTAENSQAFARWPSEDRKFVKPNSSLIGAHRVASNYAPEIGFTLTKDFMAPLTVRTANVPGGPSRLTWNGVPGATGYLAFLFGGVATPGGSGDMVMWTSSADRQFGGGLSDWLSPAQVASLVRSNTVMAPATTTCLVPAEVMAAAPGFRVGTLTAFGPEEDFAYPPRPASAKAAWTPEWTARIRHRSMTGWMDMKGGMQGMSAAQDDEGQGRSPNCKPKRGLGGMLGGMIGGGNC